MIYSSSLFSKIVITICLFFFVFDVDAYNPLRIARPCPIGITDPLPEGWQFKDIGNISPSTDWCYLASKGLFYIKANGKQIYGSGDDQCAFIYFPTDQDRQLVVRIMDGEMVTGSGASGFIMLRGGLSLNDPMAYLEVDAKGNKVRFNWRLEKGGANHSLGSFSVNSGVIGSTNNPPNCFPRWLKFIRQGLYAAAYHKDDVEGASWVKIDAVKKLGLKGKAYMGIGACSVLSAKAYSGDVTKPSMFLFDNVEVSEIVNPYELLNPESVEGFFAEPMRPAKRKDIDITSVFGHALGEYFTIECESVDPKIAEVYFWEKAVSNPSDGEPFRKYVRINSLQEGVTSIKMTCTINGFTMTTDYALCVSNLKAKKKNENTTPPYGWELKTLEVPFDKDMVWGEEFVQKNLLISKRFPIFIGSWEYDWGGVGIGNYGKTAGNNPPTNITSSEMYVSDAVTYNFRDKLVNYTMEAGYAKDTLRAESEGSSGSDIDLSFAIRNDTSYVKGFYFQVSRDSKDSIIWSECRGLWTEAIDYVDPRTKGRVRGFPYITNIQAGDWVAYTIYAPRAGYYRITPVVACKNESKSIRIDVNGITQIKELPLLKGKGGIDWKQSYTESILLNQGKNQLKVVANTRDFNLLGFIVTFKLASKEPYSGLRYDTNKYFQPEEKIDTSLMAEDEKITYDSIRAIYDTSTVEQVIRMDSILLNYPKKKLYVTDSIIDRYRDRLDNMNVPVTTFEEKLSALDTIKRKLTSSIDSITLFTSQQTTMKHIDVTSYLFKKGYDPTKPIEITMRIDTITNSGRGTYLGIMLRTLLDDEVIANSPAVSFGVGSYEGGRFSYRWGYNYDYDKFDHAGIAQDVYIKLRLNFYAPGYLTAYYSYDNLFWWDYLDDPMRIDFLSDEEVDDNIAIGMYLTGGTFTGDACLAFGKATNLTICQYDNVEDFNRQYSQAEMLSRTLTMNTTRVSGGEPVEITYDVIKPGQVCLKVYDVFGMLKEIVMDENKPFSKEPLTLTHTFTGLTESGVYLLRLQGPGNEQYIRFRYTTE